MNVIIVGFILLYYVLCVCVLLVYIGNGTYRETEQIKTYTVPCFD